MSEGEKPAGWFFGVGTNWHTQVSPEFEGKLGTRPLYHEEVIHALQSQVAEAQAKAFTLTHQLEAANAKIREQAMEYLALDQQATEAVARAVKAEAEVSALKSNYETAQANWDLTLERAEKAEEERDRLRDAGERYLSAVAALGEQSGYNRLTYFETPILKAPTDEIGDECCRRWAELNDAGKALLSASWPRRRAMLDLLRRFWRYLTGPGCGPDCPRRGPGGEMCEECINQWAIK